MVAVLITVAILLFTLFGLNYSKVEINFLNASSQENSQTFKNELLESSDIGQGSSVFFINKTKTTQKLEKKYPYLKIVNIETTFPNGLKFNVAEREELYAIKNNLNNYSLIDGDFKVLKVVSQVEFENFEIKPILIEFAGSHLINLSEGNFINKTEDTILFENLSRSFLINSRDVIEQKTLFKKVVLLNNMLVLSLQDNFEIKLHYPQQELHKKTQAMFVRMGQIYPDYEAGYLLEIYLTQDGVLLSKFTLKN